ncbi:MAG: UPF0262 family protein [Hyphomicrobiales bacterium]|nr:UPF0262 family protein [Hyphomicrobiales bacterium]
MQQTPPAGLVAVDIDLQARPGTDSFLEAERAAAVRDLLAQNQFLPVGRAGAFRLRLAMKERKLVLDISDIAGRPVVRHYLSLRPLSRVMRDYFLVCQSYEASLGNSAPGRIEAIDMGRRGLHDEGASELQERLGDKIEMDHATARRLFTLICALNWRVRHQG